jgi:hypothetical protein
VLTRNPIACMSPLKIGRKRDGQIDRDFDSLLKGHGRSRPLGPLGAMVEVEGE